MGVNLAAAMFSRISATTQRFIQCRIRGRCNLIDGVTSEFLNCEVSHGERLCLAKISNQHDIGF